MALSRCAARAVSMATARRSIGMAPVAFKSTAALDADHKAWLSKVSAFPVNEDPHMEFTLEWMLPSPVPMHVFDQPPIVVEVKNRNPDFEEMH
mmetsp:Transcript_20301/g.47010  ORF Transcript_20301/g.47010 Transcript_20301/m.47010 type:complete len:93 (-) Transcript_20301:33-311(-)